MQDTARLQQKLVLEYRLKQQLLRMFYAEHGEFDQINLETLPAEKRAELRELLVDKRAILLKIADGQLAAMRSTDVVDLPKYREIVRCSSKVRS